MTGRRRGTTIRSDKEEMNTNTSVRDNKGAKKVLGKVIPHLIAFQIMRNQVMGYGIVILCKCRRLVNCNVMI